MSTRNALVTGAGGGLGLATVECLTSHGWRVFAADINQEALQPLATNASAVPIVLDVTDSESIDSAFDSISAQADALDGIVNFAGVMGVGSITDIPEERLARILDINVMGTFRINKRFLPLVLEAKGRIVNISSETGWQTPAPFTAPYAMSKYAIEAYSHALRRELALLGVKVITIQPGPFRTDMATNVERAFDQAEAETERFARVIANLKKAGGKMTKGARDPEILARAIQSALTDKRPKPVYSVKPDALRSSLEALPLRAADRLWLKILQRGNKA